jgi:hypothetical protein
MMNIENNLFDCKICKTFRTENKHDLYVHISNLHDDYLRSIVDNAYGQ